MLFQPDIKEEELKNRIAQRYFHRFDCASILKRIDFTVQEKGAQAPGDNYILWAEAKQHPTDIYRMLAQLLITIKQDAHHLIPPKFIGCFDNEKISLIEYGNLLPIFALNDFNWTQTPSQVDNKTIETVRKLINPNKLYTFVFGQDDKELKNFIANNFGNSASLLSTLIDRNNFIFIYQKWRNAVMPYINADWDALKNTYAIYDRDFFLAELNIDDKGTTDIFDDSTVYENFYIAFHPNDKMPYELLRKEKMGINISYKFGFKGNGKDRYAEFWKLYKRPPVNEIWKLIIERIDLLVPQDVRERKGAFFTPQIWVEKSQHYLAKTLGANWQEEYYIWDCCAGTGNLLNGLTNKYHVFASTLDQQDVDVMHERIRNGANLLDSHVFQFDFLNDELLPISGDVGITPATTVPPFEGDKGGVTEGVCGSSTKTVPPFEGDKGGVSGDASKENGSMPPSAVKTGKIPNELYNILRDPDKRKKLIIYINPPYAEATSATTVTGTGANKAKVATDNATYRKYKSIIGKASNELFAQFFIRIYKEIPGCVLAEFSKLKILQASNFAVFRAVFKSRLLNAFAVPANTFDNVKGQFPIGFFIWDTQPSGVWTARPHKKELTWDAGMPVGRHGDPPATTVPPFEGVGGVCGSVGISPTTTGDESVSLSKTQSVLQDLSQNFYSIDFYNNKGEFLSSKKVFVADSDAKSINQWIKEFDTADEGIIGFMENPTPDYQNNKFLCITNNQGSRHNNYFKYNKNTLIVGCIYFAVRHCIPATWINDRDQFLYPNDRWKDDATFQTNCLVFTLFHNQNRITINHKDLKNLNDLKPLKNPFINHWIPFSEEEVGAKTLFQSHFMHDFLTGKLPHDSTMTTLTPTTRLSFAQPLLFSPQAQAVLDAGRELWRYYHSMEDAKTNAALYDIKSYFQGHNDKGKMNPNSQDPIYTKLLDDLKRELRSLGDAIEPKVYEYGFLK